MKLELKETKNIRRSRNGRGRINRVGIEGGRTRRNRRRTSNEMPQKSWKISKKLR
jgi:hypothetical protein